MTYSLSIRRKLKVAGFTLIEVLLALSVFALAGVALLSTSDTHFSSLNHIENNMVAQWVASNQLVEATLDEQWPPKNKKGNVDLAGRQWHWQQKVEATTDKEMRSITIEVRSDEKASLALASLTTFVAKENR
ncbi:type II secretion system minor pseudopilin GspI [Thalassotalea sp. 1_MG-2023]|uniref:type II secretion system minor pseudopilin GspI n=1 Tax=Thalassotalea sp. 1_MG-2023 TaxID=3062680 RepID=UPI0026E46C2B|nr:type II secretion system minor pseudopilin GspI [Thalassotalea sp. 1_MG-2023]MDO6425707.1 type II secretion system minor pseudopilin GspI [Thalassotalea sp. 1_MG-2023]